MLTVDWFFDPVSPFAYLQFQRLRGEEVLAAIRLRPVLLAGLLEHWGNLGPAEVAPKRRFTYRHITWLARRMGVPFRMPQAHPFNPLEPLRLLCAIGPTPEHVAKVFDFIWAEGRRPDVPGEMDCLGATLGIKDASLRAAMPEAKQALRSNTEEAIGRGVFGVPTAMASGELFWGLDATDMLLDFLRDPVAFEDPEMQRVTNLPAGVQRRT
jgi:2-hydroxychromene-2-carboxylate isomerase